MKFHAACAVLLFCASARAEQMHTLALPMQLPGALIGMAGGGGGHIARAPAGLFLGADGGAALMTGAGDDPARSAAAFDFRAGYAWRWGMSVQARFDDLGVEGPAHAGPLLMPSIGARYGFPLVAMPFVEANLGAAFDKKHASPAAMPGVGLAIPIHRHVMIDISGHDVIADVDGGVRHTLLFGLGVAVGFGAH